MEQDVNIPIWKTDKGMRLTENYITEENFKDIPDIKIEEVGRLHFRGKFKAGADEDHARFVTDNDSRETQETWEACYSEGVRDRTVTKELPPAVQKLHDESLTQGRDVLATADEDEKKKWLSRDGTDWSGAFGQNPAEYADRRSTRKDGRIDTNNGSIGARKSERPEAEVNEDVSDDDEEDNSDSDESDLGLRDATNDQQYDGGNDGTDRNTNGQSGSSHSKNPLGQLKNYNESKKGLHRKQRGLMQWKPMRNLAFAKDETKFAVKRTLKRGSLQGRQPDVETEA